MANIDEINIVDVAFVIDSTGSMGGLISSAKDELTKMVSQLSQTANIRTRFGLVEYKDHMDRPVTRDHAFTNELRQMQKAINSLSASGGGDMPEAVFDGLNDAVSKLDWHAHSRRLMILLGDAAPHGAGTPGDSYAKGCPCGATTQSTTAALENSRITLYAIGLTHDQYMQDAFKDLARFTGGEFFLADARKAMNAIEEILKKEFENIEFDKKVLTIWEKNLSTDEIAAMVGSNRIDVSAALSRLGTRNLLT